VTKPVVYACFAGKDELFRALLRREEERILAEIQAAFGASDLSDPQATLIEGFTGFLRAVAASPEVYRLIFLGEGGGNTAVARRIQRGRQAQVDALSLLVRDWLPRTGKRASIDATTSPRACSQRDAGPAESVRYYCSGEDGWTPETPDASSAASRRAQANI
jgi:AcrR family transcriptional regulator